MTAIDLTEVRDFMIQAHAQVINKDGSIGQKNKYTGEPYHRHPIAVAGMVATIPGARPEVIAAALLHDVVEDTRDNPPSTRITLQILADRFGEQVADYVYWLSDMEEGNRATRDQLSMQRLSQAPGAAQSIKCADIWHNTESVALLDPRYAPIYLRQKAQVLDVLTQAESGIRQLAVNAVQAGLAACEAHERAPSPRPVGR